MCFKCHPNKETVINNINNISKEIQENGTYDFRKLCDSDHIFYIVSAGSYGEDAKITALDIFRRFVSWYEVNEDRCRRYFIHSNELYKKILKCIEDNTEKSPDEIERLINNKYMCHVIEIRKKKNKRDVVQMVCILIIYLLVVGMVVLSVRLFVNL